MEWQTTTYYCEPHRLDLRILHANRQIYQEASAIFYARNMFHAECFTVALPFLKDRGTRTLSLLRKLSIIYPSPMPLDRYESDTGFDVSLSGSVQEDEREWEDLCCFISMYVPALAHLDLRVARPCNVYTARAEYAYADWMSLQTIGDFPSKRIKELATLRSDIRLTISAIDGWPFWDASDIYSGDAVQFMPICSWLDAKISRLREKNGLMQECGQARRNILEEFWRKRRERAKRRWYKVPDDEDKVDPNILQETDDWQDDASDKTQDRVS